MDYPLDKIGGEGLVAIVFFGLLLNAAINAAKLWFDWKAKGARDRIVEAASCNVPSDVVAALRDAMKLQAVNASMQQSQHDEMDRHMGRLTTALERLTERLIEALADVRARGGNNR